MIGGQRHHCKFYSQFSPRTPEGFLKKLLDRYLTLALQNLAFTTLIVKMFEVSSTGVWQLLPLFTAGSCKLAQDTVLLYNG